MYKKWVELWLLNNSADKFLFHFKINAHLHTLQTCLTTLMGHAISMEQLKLDVGLMVEKMTQITIMFRRIKLRMEEYVCLKVYILLNRGLSTHIIFNWILSKAFNLHRSGIGKHSGEIRASIEKLSAAYVAAQPRPIGWLASTHSRGICEAFFSFSSRLLKLKIFHLQIQTAANLLLESKMFYVPFVLNSATTR